MNMWGLIEFGIFALFFSAMLGVGVKAILPGNALTSFSPSFLSETSAHLGALGKKEPQENTGAEPEVTFLTIDPKVLELVQARGVYVSYFDGKNPQKEKQKEINILSKNENTPERTASVSKLMTALIAVERLPLTATTSVKKSVLQKRGAIQRFTLGSVFDVPTLTNSLLVESNNDAAWMLSEIMGSTTAFVSAMNEKANQIGMQNTSFGNPAGLDSGNDFNGNTASAKDIAKLINFIYQKHPELLEITNKREVDIIPLEKGTRYVATSTNLLLSQTLPVKIVGGKTGETPLAKKNLVLLFTLPNTPGYFVSTVMNSTNNFEDSKIIINEIARITTIKNSSSEQ